VALKRLRAIILEREAHTDWVRNLEEVRVPKLTEVPA
jgi:hypothetical protein